MSNMVASKNKQVTLKDLLEKARPSMMAVLPKHITAERLIKVALSATARKPELLACTPESLLRAVFQGAELGLEAGGLLGEGYIVPMGREATFITGYRGLIKLARQSGQIVNMEARVVHSKDRFELEYGLTPKLFHKPYLEGDPGDLLFVYAIATFVEGGKQVDVMSKNDVDRIRARSKAGKSGPWVTDYDAMALKTVLKRLCKMLPLSPELAKAVEYDNATEAGEKPQTDIDVALFEMGEDGEDPRQMTEGSRTESLKAALASKGRPAPVRAVPKVEERQADESDGAPPDDWRPEDDGRQPGEEG